MAEVADIATPDTKPVKPGWNYRSMFWWLVVIAYGVANIFLHQEVNPLAARLIDVMGLSQFLWTTRILTLAGALLILFLRWDFLRKAGRLKRVLILIPLGVVLDLSLIIYSSDRVHYPQYALLTWIAYYATGEALPAALLSFLFGYVDEAHQHWMIYANDPIAYFDWNDIVLNLLGVIAALVVLPEGTIRRVPKRNLFAAIVLWIVAMSLLVFLLNPDPVLMRAHSNNSFWLTSNIKTHYHVLNALEGTILLGLCWIITIGYYWPDRARNRAHEEACLIQTR
jgi:hypothetical protein